ncbi:hypothetical protein RF11_14673 [Thelohanellus kitauei]|uniref:Uncharacterized protein n=1 Tax=Thelohanellus kitauei TaxID=669202 RepID=A0A0C2NAW4_THEKT|nr:hypothetical protein RF11_14673 [Thelohanellus kitauei]
MSVHLILFIYFSIAHSRNLTTILIYGTFYDHVLLPHLTGIGCEHSHLFSVKRSNKVVDFDIIILHFIDHDRFMTEYLKRNFTSRKIMIVLTYVIVFLTLGITIFGQGDIYVIVIRKCLHSLGV